MFVPVEKKLGILFSFPVAWFSLHNLSSFGHVSCIDHVSWNSTTHFLIKITKQQNTKQQKP